MQQKKNFFDQFDAPAQSGMQVKPADPMRPAQTIKANNEASASNLLPAQAAADLKKSQADAIAAAIRAENDRASIAAKAEEKRLADEQRVKTDEANLARITTIINGLDNLQTDAADNNGWFETGYTGSLLRNRPGTAAYDLAGSVKGIQGNQFINALRDLKSQSATGASGLGSLTEEEGNRLLAATGNLDPDQSQKQFLDQISQAREAALAAYRRLGGKDPKIDPQMDRSNGLPAIGDQSSGMALTQGKTRAEVDPILQAVGTRVGQMIANGEPDGKIRKFLSDNGVDPSVTSIDSALQYRKSPDFKVWQRANPGKAYPIGPEFYTKQVPLNAPQALMNTAAQSAPGAFIASAGQAVSGNNLDALGGESINTGLELMRAQHPAASIAGDMAGTAMLDAIPTGKLAGLAKDAAVGAYQGYGEGNTLGGALSNTLGGAIGRGAHGLLTTAMRGVKPTSSLAYLNDAGVPLTIGQIGRGSGSTVGNAIGGLEDRAAGVPIFDAIINSARKRGEEGFNKAAFREAGGSGITGSAGVNELGQKVGNAYSFLDNAQIPMDAQFAGSQAGVRAALPDLPEFGTQLGKGLNTIDKAANVGGGVANLSGRDWQSALRATRANRSSLAGAPFSDGASGLLGDVENNLLTLAERQGPVGTLDNLKSANKLNGQYQTILSALDNGPTQARGEMFSPLRLDNASRAGARNYGGRAASMRGERPFYDLTTAGMDVMPNQVPDSGTAGRALMYSALFGAGLGGGMGAGASSAMGNDAGDGAVGGGAGGAMLLPLALTALYSKPGQKALQKALLGPRGAVANTLGDYVAGDYLPSSAVGKLGQKALSKRTLSELGSASLRDLLLLPELPQN